METKFKIDGRAFSAEKREIIKEVLTRATMWKYIDRVTEVRVTGCRIQLVHQSTCVENYYYKNSAVLFVYLRTLHNYTVNDIYVLESATLD